MNTYRFQLSYKLNGHPESYPVEVKAETPVAAACQLVASILGLFQGVTNIHTDLIA